jgi:two-component system phosphate regulon response regulator PhoB
MSRQSSPILIVEDEPGIAELLRFTLVAAGFSVEGAGTAQAARHALMNALPQAILLDWMLPDAPGITLLREWRSNSRTATLPIIMLTAKGLDEDKVRGLNEGADDYVTKPFSPRELVARINAVLRRQSPLQPAVQQSTGPITLDGERHLVRVHGLTVELGPSEFKLLRFLMAHPERVFARAQLLDHVWGDGAFLEERTVDVHIMRLRKSLGESVDCIKTIRGIGYMLKADIPG